MSIDYDKIFREVKENSARLQSCSEHDFSIPIARHTKTEIPAPTMFCNWRCSHCHGTVDGVSKTWYERGRMHAEKKHDRHD